MPKTIKQKNKNRVINSNTDSKFNKKTNIDGDNFNYVLKPTFPSTLSINEIISVIKTSSNNKKAKTFPNSFIAYKKALIKENRIRNIKLPPMGQLSKLASCYCDNEPENVKEFYRKLSEDAKSLYKQTKQNEIQILFDKNMNELEEIRENPVENIIYTQNSTSGFEDNSASLDSHNFINSFQPNFPNSTFFEYPYRMNEVTNDQEFIRMLEYESVQFTPLQVDTDYLNYTQGIKDPVENIIYTQTSTPGFENNSASLMNLMNSFLDSRNFISSFQTSFPNSNFFENPYRMNEVANDQEYIRMLECENVQFSPLQVEVPIEDIIVSTCGAASDCINYPVENENMFLPSL